MTLYAEDFQEGDTCPLLAEGSNKPCSGKLEYGPVENCSCHISRTCGACTENMLRCSECLWEVEDLNQ